MSVLSDFDLAILDMLTGGMVVGREDLEDLAGRLGVPFVSIDQSMARLGRARLVAHTGKGLDRKWEATYLWRRRVRVLHALGPTWKETSTVRDLVAAAHHLVFADLRWWEFQGPVASQRVKSRELLLFFCADCLDATNEFIVISTATYPAHSTHRFGAFHPWVRAWRIT